jgi:hypothetical protein
MKNTDLQEIREQSKKAVEAKEKRTEFYIKLFAEAVIHCPIPYLTGLPMRENVAKRIEYAEEVIKGIYEWAESNKAS